MTSAGETRGAEPDRAVLVHRVIARLNVGGPAMHVVLLTKELDADGPEAASRPDSAVASGSPAGTPHRRFRTRLIAGSVLATEGDMGWFAEEQGVEVTTIPHMSRRIAPLADLRSFLTLWRIFRRERPAVVHTHTAKAGTVGRLAAILAGVPVRVHTYHGHVLGGDYFGPLKTRIFLGIERALARWTHRLVVLTEAQKEEMSRELGVADPSKFAVVPLGLELDAFAEAAGLVGGDESRTWGAASHAAAARAAARRELDLGPDDVVVGIVGRLVPIKNHELLLEAVPRLRKMLAEAWNGSDGRLQVLVVGGGEREAELRERARALGLEDTVRWLGWRRDVTRIYPAFDVVALTSKDEGTPVAVMEALAAGVPVVARNVGGVAELLDGGELGRLVEAEDPEALSAALADAVAHPPAPTQRAAWSRSVRRRFGMAAMAEGVRRIYEEELGSPPHLAAS